MQVKYAGLLRIGAGPRAGRDDSISSCRLRDMLAALLIAASLAGSAPGQIDWKHPNNNPVRLVDRGFCVGLAWVTLIPGEVAKVDYGPDFNVYNVRGPGRAEWGAYSGFAGESTPDLKHQLLVKNGVTVFRGTDSRGEFNGYFVGDNQRQNHFFGTVFKDAPTDAAFFSRVTFGATAKARCESYWKK